MQRYTFRSALRRAGYNAYEEDNQLVTNASVAVVALVSGSFVRCFTF